MATDCVLGIFAKKPVPGQTKTRLAQTTSHDLAQRVAEALLGDSLDRFADIAARRVIVHAPAADAAYFATLGQGRYELLAQSDGDLGRRLQTFFEQMRGQGMRRIVAIGADSPTLPTENVQGAFALLAEHDIVLGPALDGGYYLIGLKADDFGVFTDIPWSTSRVLEATVAQLRDTSARLALSPPWYDVDTADDWALLRGHVLAMRRAGIDPGVPRLEGLILAQSPLAGRASDEVRRTAPLLADG